LSRTFLVRGTEPIGRLPAWATGLLRSVGLACFGLTVAAGLVGTKHPDTNIGPTLFWHGFLLGLMYATALVGDVYAFLNPWKSIVEWVQGRKRDSSQPLVAYPPGSVIGLSSATSPHLDRAVHASGPRALAAC
jgi:hypothetical protein